MGGNGLTIANNGADIEFTDGVDTYGFKFALDSTLTETRGSAYVGQVSSGGSTYQDAEPWKRKVYDNFLGGMGQTDDNKVYGGTGIGGDDSKYFYGDCKTDRGGYLLPGMARNLVYNTVSATVKTPISDGLDPLGGDEYEVPRGILPHSTTLTTLRPVNSFVAASSATITNIRVLLLIKNLISETATITATMTDSGGTVGIYTLAIDLSTAANYTGYKWFTLPKTSGTGTLTSGRTNTISIFPIYTITGGSVIFGCYGVGNFLLPYFQLMTSATPFKYWTGPLVKVEQVLNGTTYINVAITTTTHFNAALTNSGGTAPATSPECSNGGTYTSSIVFNNQLYIGTSGGIAMWNAAACAANTSASTAAAGAAFMNSPVELGGKIYYVDATGTAIFRWDGTFPVTGTNSPQIATAGFMGTGTSIINRLFLYQGNLWVIKPEGLFQLYIDPAIMDLNPGNTPRIVPVVTDLPSVHQDTGKWVQIHQGMIYFNYRDRIYQVMPGTAGPPQVNVISMPMPWYRLSYYHYVNGISSDGVNLYVSYNNLGVFQYMNQVWHPVTEFYEQVAVESQPSGLRWLPAPQGGPDSLFVGDGRALLQIPIPSAAAPYTNQIYQNHQNKCGYWISSATDMEQAEIVKFIQSVVMRAVPSGFSYKIIPVALVVPDTVNFRSLLIRSWQEGLVRDNWFQPTGLNFLSSPNKIPIATSQFDPIATGAVIPNTTAPTVWVSTDFNTIYYSPEKLSVTTTDSTTTPTTTDVLTNPPKFVKTAFILYFWNPTAGQHATTNVGVDLMAVDSMIVKYQAIQDYLAQYQCVIDFHGKVSGTDSTSLTTQQIEDSYDWLRSQTGRHSPLRVTFRVRKTGTTTRTFLFLPQNPNWLIDPTVTNLAAKDPIIKTVGLQMIATQSEYPNV